MDDYEAAGTGKFHNAVTEKIKKRFGGDHNWWKFRFCGMNVWQNQETFEVWLTQEHYSDLLDDVDDKVTMTMCEEELQQALPAEFLVVVQTKTLFLLCSLQVSL